MTTADYGILGVLVTKIYYRWNSEKSVVDILAVYCRSLSNENLINKLPKRIISNFEIEIIEANAS